MIYFYLTLLENPENKALFIEMYHSHLSILTRTGQRFFSEPSFIEDALQMAWESIARSFSKISSLPPTEVTPYLVTVMKNKCKDILRKEKKYVELFTDEVAVLEDDFSETIFIEQDYQELVALIRKMPDTYREVLERRLILEESNIEIAKSMSISEALVAKRYSRGRSLLIESLSAKDGYYE